MHVLLHTYNPTSKEYDCYDALVLTEAVGPTKPTLALCFHDHLDTSALHALQGVDWRDTIKRVLDVPHKDDRVNQSFYYVESDAADKRHIAALRSELTKTKVKLAAALKG